MPDDELRNTVHAIVARLQSDVEAQLAELEERHRAAHDAVRREAEATARAETTEHLEREWAAKLEQVRAESDLRLRAELAEAAALADQRVAAETARLLAEAEYAASELTSRLQLEREQAVLEAATRAREEVKQQVDAEHKAALDAERNRLTAELEAERQERAAVTASLRAADAALSSERSARESAEANVAALESRHESRVAEQITGARAEERQVRIALVEQLMLAVRSVSEARSLSDTLNGLAAVAASMAPRVALFIINERSASRELQGWRASGFADGSPALLHLPADDGGMLATAASSRTAVSTSIVSAPEFAALPADRAALAVPLTVGGKTVAVLYADDGIAGEPEAPASWPEAMQILGAHASVCLSHITAVRTTQAMRATVTGAGRGPANESEEDHSARRYARLLVSEIKLYNEAAVRTGREKRDLLSRLRPEIDRARRLYEERIPASIAARARYFHEELVHTLADGDAALLGSA